MAIEIVRRSISEMREALRPLLEAHCDELTTHKDLMQLDPRWEAYELMELSGILIALFVLEDGWLIGYSAATLSRHLHYGGLVYAQVDVLYLLPEYRKSRTGLALIRATEDACREAGARFLVQHAKPDTAMDRLLPRLGYGVQDILYSKEL